MDHRRIEPRVSAPAKLPGPLSRAGPPFGLSRMVAWTGLSNTQDPAGVVANHGGCAGLAAIHSQKQSHGNW